MMYDKPPIDFLFLRACMIKAEKNPNVFGVGAKTAVLRRLL